MTKLFGHSVRSQHLLLYLVETVVCFLTVYALLRLGMGQAVPPLTVASGIACAAVLAISASLVAGASGLYRTDAWHRLGRFLLGCAVAAGLLLLVAQIVLALLAPGLDGVAHWNALAIVLAGLVAAIMSTHLAFALAARRGLMRHRIAALRAADGAAPVELHAEAGEPFDVALDAPLAAIDGPAFASVALQAARIRTVVVADPAALPAARRADWQRAGLRVLSAVEFAEARTSRVDLAALAPGWLDALPAGRAAAAQARLRRGIDVAGSLALLTLTLPLLLLTALAIRLDSPGPVLYRQERVGRNGRVFTLLKFRSMRADAEAPGSPRWAAARDDRVTRVGRFIRLTRIDEIPQAINVLRGDMALVGPRPERPAFVEQLSRVIPHYQARASVRPGITGWAQVNYPYGASVEDARMKLAYDLYYVKHRSLFLDLLILVATVRVVLFQEGSR
jgi:exopolysaccharide biosynthesis polyprenyl glycosylphosphotransferase